MCNSSNILNSIYWFICFIICLWILFGLGALIFLIASILYACGCSDCCKDIEKIGLAWLKSPGVCMDRCCRGKSMSCDCIFP